MRALLLFLVFLLVPAAHSLSNRRQSSVLGEFYQVEIHVQTSSCSKAGTNDQISLWIAKGSIAQNRVKIVKTSSIPVNGPYAIDGSSGDQLERNHHDTIFSTNFNDGYGHKLTFKDLEKNSVLIMKKTNGFWSALSGSWKPEKVTIELQKKQKGRSQKTDNRTVLKARLEFRMDAPCSYGWISDEDYYLVSHKGTFYHLKNSAHLTLAEIADHYDESNVECIVEYRDPINPKPSSCPVPFRYG
uniref:Secreted protein n=1 Tax=Steinernema glaseri TaxID=37863 RepID=A0A1I7ZNS4_9BILA